MTHVVTSLYGCETVQLLQQETLDFIVPNNPVDYRICGLMQEYVYIVQDTSPRHRRLDMRTPQIQFFF